jgi:membrane-associated phospholipid phosphatase
MHVRGPSPCSRLQSRCSGSSRQRAHPRAKLARHRLLLVAVAGSQLVVVLLKDSLDRPRLDVGSALLPPNPATCPSGHATAGAASLGALAVLLAERLPSQRGRTWLWAALVVGGSEWERPAWCSTST